MNGCAYFARERSPGVSVSGYGGTRQDWLEDRASDVLERERYDAERPRVTTWGEIDETWIGAVALVRWEDGGDIGPDSLSGVPHEYRVRIVQVRPDRRVLMTLDGVEVTPPAHALVQEVTR